MSDNSNFVFTGFEMPAGEEITAWNGEGGGVPNIPPGEYLLEVTEMEMNDTNSGDGKNIVPTFKVVSDGDGNGETFRQWYLAVGPKVKKGHRGRLASVFREGLRVPGLDPVSLSFDLKRAVGCRMWATVKLEESPPKFDPQTQTSKTFTNIRISNERPYEEAGTESEQQAAPPPPPPPAPKAPSAPPARPPAPRPAAPPARRA